MKRRSALISLLVLASAACVGSPEADDDVNSTVQNQIKPGFGDWREVKLTFSNGVEFGRLFLFNTAMGGYQTNKEYWYVNLSSLSYMGTKSLNITSTDYTTSTTPVDPGYASEQTFSLPTSTSWGTGWTTDPLSGGTLFTGPNSQALRITKSGSPAQITAIAWYQVLKGTSPSNITPSGTFALGSTSVSVPSGYSGYDITQSP